MHSSKLLTKLDSLRSRRGDPAIRSPNRSRRRRGSRSVATAFLLAFRGLVMPRTVPRRLARLVLCGRASETVRPGRMSDCGRARPTRPALREAEATQGAFPQERHPAFLGLRVDRFASSPPAGRSEPGGSYFWASLASGWLRGGCEGQ